MYSGLIYQPIGTFCCFAFCCKVSIRRMPCCLVLLDNLCFNEMRKITSGGRVGCCCCGRLMKLYCLSDLFCYGAALSWRNICTILCHVSRFNPSWIQSASVGLCSSLFDVNKHSHHLPPVRRVEREQERAEYNNLSDQQHTTNNVGNLTS